MVFVPGGTLKGICSTTPNCIFSRSMFVVRNPIISLMRSPYIPASTTGISHSVPITLLIKVCICSMVYGSGVFACLPNFVIMSRAGLCSMYRYFRACSIDTLNMRCAYRTVLLDKPLSNSCWNILSSIAGVSWLSCTWPIYGTIWLRIWLLYPAKVLGRKLALPWFSTHSSKYSLTVCLPCEATTGL